MYVKQIAEIPVLWGVWVLVISAVRLFVLVAVRILVLVLAIHIVQLR